MLSPAPGAKTTVANKSVKDLALTQLSGGGQHTKHIKELEGLRWTTELAKDKGSDRGRSRQGGQGRLSVDFGEETRMQ